ncbi:hypothetical protein Tco_0962459, partial [Tanacetum coccineum]
RNSENVDTIIESPSPSPIPVEDSNSHMEEIDLFLASDDSMPPGIENDNYDSEGDICFLEEFLSNDPLPLPEIESSNLDHFNDPSSPHPPPEPPDVEICFDVEPDTTVKNDFDELNKDECFDPGGIDPKILKTLVFGVSSPSTRASYPLLAIRLPEFLKPLMLTVFVLHSLELHILSFILGIRKSDNDDVYDDPFDSKEDKTKESKLLIDELDPPRSSDFLPSPNCDSVLYEDFSKVDALPSTNNEDKVFNLGILIHKNLFEVTIRATPDKNVKKISISNVSLILEDFNPPLYELPFHKEVPGPKTLLSFSSENEEKVFNLGILTSKGVHTSLLLELSHRGPKAFKVIKNFESPMEIFPCSYGEDIFWMFCVSISIPHKQLNSGTGQAK